MAEQHETGFDLLWTPGIGRLIELAVEEDLGRGDVTTEILGERRCGTGRIVAREHVVVCGLPLVPWIIRPTFPDLRLSTTLTDGTVVEPGTELARISGPVSAILCLERTMLNFLARLSGVSTLTRQYVDQVRGTPARIVETRKTLPGWRVLDKYAVRRGGGTNHRMDLGSGILIKDNHIVACGSIREAVTRARSGAPHSLRIEIEVETLDGALEALHAGAEIILLDNMSVDTVKEVVQAIGDRAQLEVSGGVNLQSVRSFAEAGVHLISVGAMTHSARSVDLSLELEI